MSLWGNNYIFAYNFYDNAQNKQLSFKNRVYTDVRDYSSKGEKYKNNDTGVIIKMKTITTLLFYSAQ